MIDESSKGRSVSDAKADLAIDLGEIIDDVGERLRRGEAVEIERLAVQYPEQADDIRAMAPTLQAVAALGRNDASTPSQPPRELGDFRIVREIGRGGMGVVYEAEQLSVGRKVALKVLPFAAMLDERSLQRFRNEVRAVAALDHPNIVSVYSVGEERGVHFFAMQLIRGQSLATFVSQRSDRDRRLSSSSYAFDASCDATANNDANNLRGNSISNDAISNDLIENDSVAIGARETVPETLHSTAHSNRRRDYARAAARLGVQAAEALQHAHERGVIHRDVKPANLLLDARGKLWVTDFGLAQIESDANLTMTGDMIGTLRYMSPEQSLGRREQVDRRTDVYSLGVTLYELLALQPIFLGADRKQLLRSITFEDPEPLRQIDAAIPVELEMIVAKAIEKDPVDRYQSSGELADDLTRYLENKPIAARRPTTLQRVAKWTQRHHQVAFLGALSLVLLAVVLAVSMVFVLRAESRAVAALERTSDVLYATDMTLAYQTFDKGWSDEVQSILDRYRPRAGQTDRRGLEWHLLQRLIEKPVSTTLAGHEGSVNELAVFPDRSRLASVGDDGTLKIWDVDGRRLLRTIAICNKPLYSVAVSQDGRFIAAGSNSVYLYEVGSGGPVKELFCGDHNVESMAFHADGTRIFAGFRYNEVCLLSLDGRLLKQIPCDSRIESLEFLPNGAGLLIPTRREADDSRPESHVIELWDDDLSGVKQIYGAAVGAASRFTVARPSPLGDYIAVGEKYRKQAFILQKGSGRVLVETPTSRDRLTDVAYSPDGKSVGIGYQNGIMELFELEFSSEGEPNSANRSLVVDAHSGGTFAVRFVDEDLLATCGADGAIRLWTPQKASVDSLDLIDQRIVGARLSPDGKLLLCTLLHEFVVVNVDRDEVVARSSSTRAKYSHPAWSPKGDRAVFFDLSAHQLIVIDRTGRRVSTIDIEGDASSVEFSHDGSLAAAISKEQLEVCVAESGEKFLHRTIPIHGKRLAFSHDGSQLACGGEFGKIIILDMESRQIVREFDGRSNLHCLEYSPDDATIASGHGDSVIRVWSVARGRLQAELMGHSQSVYDLAFSPDSRTLLSSSEDNTVRIWSVEHHRGFGVLVRRPESRIDPGCYLSMSSDAQKLAVIYRSHVDGESDVLFWDLSQTNVD